MSFKLQKISYRLIFIILSLSAVSGSIAFYTYLKISEKIMKNNLVENAENIVEKNVNEIEKILLRVEKIPKTFVGLLENTGYDPQTMRKHLENIVENNKEIYGAALAFEPYVISPKIESYSLYSYRNNDEIISIDLNSKEYDYFTRDWYQIPVILKKPFWTEPYYDEGAGEVMMSTYSFPIINSKSEKEEVLGIATIDIELNWLSRLVDSIKIYETGFAFLISRHGKFVTFRNSSFIMNESVFSIADEYNHPELRQLGKKMIKQEKGLEILSRVFDLDNAWLFYHPIISSSWSLAVVVPEDEILSDLTELNIALFIVSIIGLALLILTVSIASEKITSPLHSLAEAAKEIGTGKFDVRLPVIKSNDEVKMLSNSFKFMLRELKNYIENLRLTAAAKEKIESELRIAREIQMGLIPKSFPPFPDHPDIEMYAFIKPAREVGGDLYDFFFIDNSKLCFAIGDVTGKGVPASLFMAVTRTLLRAKADKGRGTDQIIHEINFALSEDNESQMFVTFFIGILDLETGIMEYTNAGHNFPYLLKSNGSFAALNQTHGLPLGVFAAKDYESEKIDFAPGDKLILYTDGVNEAMNSKGELYTDMRLINSIKKLSDKNSKECVEIIVDDISKFTEDADQSDDITILLLTLLTDH